MCLIVLGQYSAVSDCLASHSNEHVGLLRERLAKQIGCSMADVRMFCLGECGVGDTSGVAAAARDTADF
jgi:hypothetical protein